MSMNEKKVARAIAALHSELGQHVTLDVCRAIGLPHDYCDGCERQSFVLNDCCVLCGEPIDGARYTQVFIQLIAIGRVGNNRDIITYVGAPPRGYRPHGFGVYLRQANGEAVWHSDWRNMLEAMAQAETIAGRPIDWNRSKVLAEINNTGECKIDIIAPTGA